MVQQPFELPDVVETKGPDVEPVVRSGLDGNVTMSRGRPSQQVKDKPRAASVVEIRGRPQSPGSNSDQPREQVRSTQG